jgi:hypothetical protein
LPPSVVCRGAVGNKTVQDCLLAVQRVQTTLFSAHRCAPGARSRMTTARVQEHRTHRGEDRLVVRFSARPDSRTLALVRSLGKYRRGAQLQPPCWYLTCSREELLQTATRAGCQSLLDALSAEGQSSTGSTFEEEAGSAAEVGDPLICPACAVEAQGNDTAQPHTLRGDCWFGD